MSPAGVRTAGVTAATPSSRREVGLDGGDGRVAVRRAGQVHRDEQRAVDARAEGGGDRVVGPALRAVGRRGGVRRQALAHVERRDGDDPEADDDRQQQRHAAAQRRSAPSAPPSPGAGVGLALGVARGEALAAEHAAAEEAEQRRQQGQRDDDGAEDGGGGAEPHRGEERDADHGEGGERDDDGQPGEDHGRPGGADRAAGGLLAAVAGEQLVPVARHDEQGVVDADGETEHDGEREAGRADVEEAGGDRDRRGRRGRRRRRR